MRCVRGWQVGSILHWVVAVAWITIFLGCGTLCEAETPATRLATVNGHPVLQRDVELELLLSGVSQPTPADRDAALERAIDRILVAKFVATKGTDPLAEDVENLVQLVRKGIESGGDTVEVVLGKLHLTEEDVRRSAQLSVSWNAYVSRTITPKEIRDYFDSHREEFDGTKVRVSQIVQTVPATGTPADWNKAEKLLMDLRQQIQSGTLDFAEAARAHSTSPSSQQGGDIGLIRFRGDVPAAVSAAAFALKPGEISQPIRSPVGVHLIQANSRQAGDLSLEDARMAIQGVLGEQLWEKTVKTLRAKARIVK